MKAAITGNTNMTIFLDECKCAYNAEETIWSIFWEKNKEFPCKLTHMAKSLR